MTTTSSLRDSGMLAKTSFTRSALGSIRSTLRPALMSAKARCNMVVDLPVPVAPVVTVAVSVTDSPKVDEEGFAPSEVEDAAWLTVNNVLEDDTGL